MKFSIDRSHWSQVVPPEQSNLGVSIYVSKVGSFMAVCEDCNIQLGWTWNDKKDTSSTGFWSCKMGCKKRFNNELGHRTSSIRYPDDERDLTTWVAGWLGVARENVTVAIW